MLRTRTDRDPLEKSASSRLFIPSLPTFDLTSAVRPAPPRARRWDPEVLVGGGGRRRVELSYLARAGVYRAVRHFLGAEGGVVLMPAYHHGVEVEAVRAAGATVRFYRVDLDMRLDLEDLRRKAAEPDVRVLYVTHFVGFPQPVAAVKAIAEQRGQRVFEDCALALFSADPDGRPLGTTGDAAVYCLYKTLPVPHGGLLLAPEGLAPAALEPAPLASTLHHAAGLFLADLELRAGAIGRGLRALARAAAHRTVDAVVENVQTGTMTLDPRDLRLGASPLVPHLLARVDAARVVARRRHNFARLARGLGGVLPVIGHPLARGVCPLFLPVRVARGRKQALKARLEARGIDAVDFWGTGDPACAEREFPEVARLRREVLELPCHQSLSDADIDRLALAVREELARLGKEVP